MKKNFYRIRTAVSCNIISWLHEPTPAGIAREFWIVGERVYLSARTPPLRTRSQRCYHSEHLGLFRRASERRRGLTRRVELLQNEMFYLSWRSASDDR